MNKVELVEFSLQDIYRDKASQKLKMETALENIKSTVEHWNKQGYKVLSVTPLTGNYSFYERSKTFTCGVVIIFEKY